MAKRRIHYLEDGLAVVPLPKKAGAAFCDVDDLRRMQSEFYRVLDESGLKLDWRERASLFSIILDRLMAYRRSARPSHD